MLSPISVESFRLGAVVSQGVRRCVLKRRGNHQTRLGVIEIAIRTKLEIEVMTPKFTVLNAHVTKSTRD